MVKMVQSVPVWDFRVGGAEAGVGQNKPGKNEL
jgi:hypothetical protein